MRREGFDLSGGRLRALMRGSPESSAPFEPIEEIQIAVDDALVSDVVNALRTARN